MSVAVSEVGIASTFPEAAVASAIKSWWAEEMGSGSQLRDPFAKSKPSGGTVFDVQPTMDSLRAVKALLTLEEIVPFELPDELVKLGGYDSLAEMVGHLVPRIGALWKKHAAKKEMQ